MGGSQSAKINWHHFRCVTFIYLEIFFAESKSVTQHSQHDGLLILRLRHFLAEPSMISKWRWTIVQLSRQLWMRAVLFASKAGDRKSTRLNSSHVKNSYAVFCLKKKK